MPDISALMAPRSIAIIGASPNTAILRGKIQHLLEAWRYPGAIYPVSRSHDEVQGRRAYRTVEEIGASVEAAVLIIPAAEVPAALESCGRIGVRGAYIVSSGFAEEAGTEGARLQTEIRAIADRFDMAVCGPNGEGYLNAGVPLVATFAAQLESFAQPLLPATTHARSISVVSQSGGMGFSMYHRGRPRQLRFAHVVSVGNEASLGAFDIVEWCLGDGAADVVLMYLETIRDVATFRRVAALAADRGKPIVVAKMGRSAVGARAAASHTAALAGSDAAYDAVFRQYGVTRAYDMDQLLDVAAGFSYCPLPKGKRVAVLASSGGSGVWMSDTLAMQGLDIPVLDDATRAEIDALIPVFGSSANPIDLTAQAVRDVGYARVAEILLRSPCVDIIVIVGSLIYPTTLKRDAEAIGRLVQRAEKPIVFCSYTLAAPEAIEVGAAVGLPIFTSMPGCGTALLALIAYADFRARWRTRSAVPSLAAAVLPPGGTTIGEYQAKKLLEPYGVTRADEYVARDASEAVAAADRLGYPVALKIHAPDLVHKTELGGVRLGLADAAAVRTAFDAMMTHVRAGQPTLAIDGALVQRMARPGIEMMVGVTRDADFGPMLLVGFGGVHVEVLRDTALAPAPIDAAQAMALLRQLRAYRLLEGVRGQLAADMAALCATMVAVSRFAAANETVAEIDLNPVIVHAAGQGVTVVDALIIRDAAG